ncbi:hypothetical protein KP79_PYT14671 [Mizuhopecten yessoensis]|uniref:Uncharacterized protein n=1 Tax=Mizuhopecten yessoensis TaxID=6573 RepID=A0A210R2Z7_MIZYE|nr:hypothetical protein KP79_PYT14671 [Mizuhopecten yessoensis]
MQGSDRQSGVAASGPRSRCHATVHQVWDAFTRGEQPHVHAGDLKLDHRAKMSVKVKQQSTSNVFR